MRREDFGLPGNSDVLVQFLSRSKYGRVSQRVSPLLHTKRVTLPRGVCVWYGLTGGGDRHRLESSFGLQFLMGYLNSEVADFLTRNLSAPSGTRIATLALQRLPVAALPVPLNHPEPWQPGATLRRYTDAVMATGAGQRVPTRPSDVAAAVGAGAGTHAECVALWGKRLHDNRQSLIDRIQQRLGPASVAGETTQQNTKKRSSSPSSRGSGCDHAWRLLTGEGSQKGSAATQHSDAAFERECAARRDEFARMAALLDLHVACWLGCRDDEYADMQSFMANLQVTSTRGSAVAWDDAGEP